MQLQFNWKEEERRGVIKLTSRNRSAGRRKTYSRQSEYQNRDLNSHASNHQPTTNRKRTLLQNCTTALLVRASDRTLNLPGLSIWLFLNTELLLNASLIHIILCIIISFPIPEYKQLQKIIWFLGHSNQTMHIIFLLRYYSSNFESVF